MSYLFDFILHDGTRKWVQPIPVELNTVDIFSEPNYDYM